MAKVVTFCWLAVLFQNAQQLPARRLANPMRNSTVRGSNISTGGLPWQEQLYNAKHATQKHEERQQHQQGRQHSDPLIPSQPWTLPPQFSKYSQHLEDLARSMTNMNSQLVSVPPTSEPAQLLLVSAKAAVLLPDIVSQTCGHQGMEALAGMIGELHLEDKLMLMMTKLTPCMVLGSVDAGCASRMKHMQQVLGDDFSSTARDQFHVHMILALLKTVESGMQILRMLLASGPNCTVLHQQMLEFGVLDFVQAVTLYTLCCITNGKDESMREDSRQKAVVAARERNAVRQAEVDSMRLTQQHTQKLNQHNLHEQRRQRQKFAVIEGQIQRRQQEVETFAVHQDPYDPVYQAAYAANVEVCKAVCVLLSKDALNSPGILSTVRTHMPQGFLDTLCCLLCQGLQSTHHALLLPLAVVLLELEATETPRQPRPGVKERACLSNTSPASPVLLHTLQYVISTTLPPTGATECDSRLLSVVCSMMQVLRQTEQGKVDNYAAASSAVQTPTSSRSPASAFDVIAADSIPNVGVSPPGLVMGLVRIAVALAREDSPPPQRLAHLADMTNAVSKFLLSAQYASWRHSLSPGKDQFEVLPDLELLMMHLANTLLCQRRQQRLDRAIQQQVAPLPLFLDAGDMVGVEQRGTLVGSRPQGVWGESQWAESARWRNGGWWGAAAFACHQLEDALASLPMGWVRRMRGYHVIGECRCIAV